MKTKTAMCLIGLGIGGTILYQQVKNGNLRKMVRKMNRAKTRMLENIEDMM